MNVVTTKRFFSREKENVFSIRFDLSGAAYSSCCATKRTNHEEHVDQKQDMSMLIDGMFSQGRTYEEFLHEQFFITPHFGAKYERSTAPSSKIIITKMIRTNNNIKKQKAGNFVCLLEPPAEGFERDMFR